MLASDCLKTAMKPRFVWFLNRRFLQLFSNDISYWVIAIHHLFIAWVTLKKNYIGIHFCKNTVWKVAWNSKEKKEYSILIWRGEKWYWNLCSGRLTWVWLIAIWLPWRGDWRSFSLLWRLLCLLRWSCCLNLAIWWKKRKWSKRMLGTDKASALRLAKRKQTPSIR